MDRTTTFAALHDIGAAAWFGGSLMGVTGLNAAADAAGEPTQRAQVASAGWARWTPIARAALGAHLVGSLGLLRASRSRGAVVGLGLTTAAIGATAGTAVLGGREGQEETVRVLEWAVPALLAAVVVAGARRSR